MTKKRVGKRSKAKSVKTKEVKPEDLIPAHYNPRIMDEDSSKALKQSMEEFSDISGITWNKTTSNIVTGHHRWQNLIDAHGLENLKFDPLSDDKYSIFSDDGDTGFILRVVEWDDAKEKAANVTANSHTVEGIFTEDLQSVLDEIKLGIDDDLFGNLRLDELDIFKDEREHDEMDWDSDLPDPNAPQPEDGDLNRDLGVRITVMCLFQDKPTILEAVNTALKGFENVQIK